MKGKTRIIQISNIAPQATKDQMSTLFGFLGKIEDIRLYPTVRDVAIPVQSRICFIKFFDRDTVGVSQHLTNTVFIDRALIVVPFSGGDMVDESTAMEIINSCGAAPGVAQDLQWPPHVKNQVDGIILRTTDPLLTEKKLPEYPNLPATTESFKVHEIRRTLVFDGVDPAATSDQVMEFASEAGEVRYLRMGVEEEGEKNALVEYCDQAAVIPALQLHDRVLLGKHVRVNHSTAAIIKPQTKSNEAAQREIEEAMRRVKEAQNSLFSANMDPLAFLDAATKPHDERSRSRDRKKRSRTRSPSRRKRSRSRHRTRSRSRRKSRSRSRKSRSRSRSRKDKDRENGSSRRDKDRKRERSSRSSKDKVEKEDKHADDTKKDAATEEVDKATPSEEPKQENKEENAETSQAAVEQEKSSKEKEVDNRKEKDSSREKKSSSYRSKGRSKSRSKSRDRRPRRRSRSRSRSRRKSRSRSRRRKAHRSRSRSRSRRSRSRSRSRRDRSKDRKRSRTPDRSHRRTRSSSRSRRDARRERSRSKGRDRDRKRDDRDRKDRKRDKKDKEDRKSDSKIARDYDEEEVGYEGEEERAAKLAAEQSKDKEETVDMDISNSP